MTAVTDKVLHVGIDVDDTSFHGAGFCSDTGEMFEFKCKPTKGALLTKLRKLEKKGFELKVCYEATYIGFSLHRELDKEGIECTVVASSLIPELPSNRVKTDRLDSLKLATYFSKDLLTPVHVPDSEDEEARSLIRSRSFLVNQRSNLKKHILSSCRCYGIDYKGESKGKHYWTQIHLEWLSAQLKKLGESAQKNIALLLNQYNSLSETITQYNDEIEHLATKERYKKKKEALCCFRGLGTVSAMTLITEIGDPNRFSHPGQLTSYAGLDIREYSSGGREKKFGITKMGNHRIRTTVVEACQVTGTVHISKRLKAARQGQPEEIVAIADKCMKRLRKRSYHLQEKNKHSNKIKVACARELLNFTWEALKKVS